jgi:hypothetical protein
MNKSRRFILLTILLTACTTQAKIAEEEGRLKISTGGYELTARGLSAVDDSFMIVGWTVNAGLPGYEDAGIACIPMDKVEDLKQKYGDFMRCDNPGAGAAKQSVTQLDIILSSQTLRPLIRQIKGLQQQNRYPVFHVAGKELQVDQAKYWGIPVTPGSQSKTVLADMVELVRDDYSF